MAEETQNLIVGQQPLASTSGVHQLPAGAASSLPMPPARPPKRNPILTHDDMVKVIRGGGSVIINGEVIAHEHLLPTEAELAKGDADRTAAATASFDQQIAALSRQRSLLTDTAKAPETKPTEPAKSLADKPK